MTEFHDELFELDADGLVLTVSRSPLKPGDTYVAKRNLGWQLLTVHHVDQDLNCVISNEGVYPYDIRECLKVEAGL